MPESTVPTFYSPAEIAQQWQVRPAKVYSWIRAGELRAINMAENPDGQRARWKITPQAAADFLKSRESKPPPPTPEPRRRVRRSVKQYV